MRWSHLSYEKASRCCGGGHPRLCQRNFSKGGQTLLRATRRCDAGRQGSANSLLARLSAGGSVVARNECKRGLSEADGQPLRPPARARTETPPRRRATWSSTALSNASIATRSSSNLRRV